MIYVKLNILGKSLKTISKNLIYNFFNKNIIDQSYIKNKKLLIKLGLNQTIRFQNLPYNTIQSLIIFFNTELSNFEIKKEYIKNIKKLQENLNTFKYIRKKYKYPANGQRTRSNAKTVKKY